MNQTKKDVNANSRGSLLKEMEVDSDCEVPAFSLPKSVVKRPRKSIKKRPRSRWRKYCGMFCRYCSNVVLVLVITACLLSIALLFWFSLRLYRDVENLSRRLTIEINRVQAEQAENIEKCNALKMTVREDRQKNRLWQQDILLVKHQLGISFFKIYAMNHTLVEISYQLQDANNKVMIKSKVDALQKGMADTGAEMSKLSDQVKQIEQQTSLQSSTIRRINSGLWNVSQGLTTNTTGKSLFHFLKHILDPINDDAKNRESMEPKSSDKSSFLSDKTPSDIVEMVNAVNQSLFSKVLDLQNEILALKMKLNGHQFGDPSLPHYNLSRSVGKVKRDLFSIQLLLKNVSSRIHNLAQLTNIETIKQVNVNTNAIKLLWDELGIQNYTIVDILQRIDTNQEYKSERLQELPKESETTDKADDFEIFPKPNDQTRIGNRRDVSKNEYERQSRQSNLGRKHSDIYGDEVNDDEYVD